MSSVEQMLPVFSNLVQEHSQGRKKKGPDNDGGLIAGDRPLASGFEPRYESEAKPRFHNEAHSNSEMVYFPFIISCRL